jgi:hypothetical protein
MTTVMRCAIVAAQVLQPGCVSSFLTVPPSTGAIRQEFSRIQDVEQIMVW